MTTTDDTRRSPWPLLVAGDHVTIEQPNGDRLRREVIAGGMVITTDYALTVKSSAFPGLKYADALTVDGAAYTVREVRAQDDGQFSTVYLSKV